MRKRKTDTLPACLIRAHSEELGTMIAAILREDVRTVAEPPFDILITEETDCIILSLPDGSDPVRMERPFTPHELKQAVGSRTRGQNALLYSADPDTRSAVLGEASVTLTETEFRLYSAILENGDRFTTAEELSLAVWGKPDRNLCTVYISYLRRKLDAVFGDGTLVTARGKGYRLRSTKHV